MANAANFTKFLFFGGVAALANMGSRFLLNIYLGYTLSIIIAFGIGMLTAFLCFKFYVFGAQSSHNTCKEVIVFVIINMFALVQTLVVSIGLAEYVFPWIHFTLHSHDIAHAFGVAVPMLTSYFGHKYLTFGRNAHVAY